MYLLYHKTKFFLNFLFILYLNWSPRVESNHCATKGFYIETTVLASNQCFTLAWVCPSQLDEPWIKLFTNQTMSNSIHILSVTLDAHLGWID